MSLPTPILNQTGDGANDVGMLLEAHVGVGISGNEGQQAVNASDFAIAQFRFLKRLILVHGRWDYRRISRVVLYSFYKNMVLVVTLFLYLLYCGFSGTSLFEGFTMAQYNFFLGLPIITVRPRARSRARRTVQEQSRHQETRNRLKKPH